MIFQELGRFKCIILIFWFFPNSNKVHFQTIVYFDSLSQNYETIIK